MSVVRRFGLILNGSEAGITLQAAPLTGTGRLLVPPAQLVDTEQTLMYAVVSKLGRRGWWVEIPQLMEPCKSALALLFCVSDSTHRRTRLLLRVTGL